MRRFFVLALVMLLAGLAQAKNYVVNGDMETGGSSSTPPSGWSINSPNTAVVSADVPPGGGAKSVKLHKTGTGEVRFSRTVSGLTGNTPYIFDFWFKGSQIDVSMSYGSNVFESRTIFWEYYFDPKNPDPETTWTYAPFYDYGPYPWVVKTPAGATSISIVFRLPWNDATAYLDNVRLVDNPEPASLSILALAGLGMFLRRRRRFRG